MIDLSLLLPTILLLRIFRMSLMKHVFFWHLTKSIVRFLEINLLWLAGENPNYLKITWLLLKLNVNHLHIIKVHLNVGLDAKFVLLLRKLILLQNKNKSDTFYIRKGILKCSTNLVVYLTECKSCPKQYVGSTITPFIAVLIIKKAWLEKCLKFIPRNIMSIKNNFIVTLGSQSTLKKLKI